MVHCFLVFKVASDTWALFQIKRVFHSWMTNLLIRFVRVIETIFTLWQLAAFVSDRILDVVVVSTWRWRRFCKFLFIFCKIVLLSITDANLLGSTSFVGSWWEFVLVLNWHFLVDCLKRRWNSESFVGSHAEFEICKRLIVFLVRVFCTWGRAKSLELSVSLRTPRKLRLVSNRMRWPSFLFW